METLRNFGLGIAILGIFLMCTCGADAISTLGKSVDLYDEETDITTLSKLKYIETDVYLSLDCYATEETTTKQNGAVTGRRYTYYYIIPAFSGDDVYWIGVKVKENEYRTYDKIVDETIDYLVGDSEESGMTTIALSGRLKKQKDELFKYMEDWFREMEWYDDEADFEKHVLPLYIDPFEINYVRIPFFIGLGCLLIGILFVVIAIRGRRR